MEIDVHMLEEAMKRADVWATAYHAYTKIPSSNQQERKSSFQVKQIGRPSPPPTGKSTQPVRGHNCGEHIRPQCPQNSALFAAGKHRQQEIVNAQKVGFCGIDQSSLFFIILQVQLMVLTYPSSMEIPGFLRHCV